MYSLQKEIINITKKLNESKVEYQRLAKEKTLAINDAKETLNYKPRIVLTTKLDDINNHFTDEMDVFERKINLIKNRLSTLSNYHCSEHNFNDDNVRTFIA